MKIAILGLGHMGTMIATKILESRTVTTNDIIIKTSSSIKAERLRDLYPGTTFTDSNQFAVQQAETIIVCCKPHQISTILDEISIMCSHNKHIISIAACVSIEDILEKINCQVSRIMPTILSEINEGITLFCHHASVNEANRQFSENLFSSFSRPYIVSQDNFETAADLTSCGPGFFSAIITEFINAVSRNSTISSEAIEEMMGKTLYGFSKLASNLSYSDIISRVATKGGITEEGNKTLFKNLPQTFDELLNATLYKRNEIKKGIRTITRE